MLGLFRKFSLSLVFSWFSGLAVSWGFFAVVKNCDKLNVRGELCCAAHTLLLELHRHRSVGGRVPHFHQHVSRARGKTLYFCLFCYIFSVVFRFTTARIFACLLRAVCNIYSRVLLLLLHSSSPMGDCSYQSSL